MRVDESKLDRDHNMGSWDPGISRDYNTGFSA